jgi:Ser/Thr protein kinase RdoA (MazF antagonist)
MSVTGVGDTGSPGRTIEAFSAAAASTALIAACARAELDASGARLVRLGENAVFRLATRPVIVRVARTAAYLPEVQRGMDVARWLHGAGFPAVRLVDDIEQPSIADGRVVTFWEMLSDEYATVADLAVLLLQLHAMAPPPSLSLPTLLPLERTRRRVEAGPLATVDKKFLIDRVEELSSRWNAVEFELPSGVIHGDASVGNVIRAQDGRPVLIDLDGFSTGPREWDLMLTALYYERLGWHTREEYQGFAERYGFDVTAWRGYGTLRSIRELIMVGWLAQNIDESSDVVAEVSKRIADLRAGREGRLEWKPF